MSHLIPSNQAGEKERIVGDVNSTSLKEIQDKNGSAVFISYAREDQEFVRDLRKSLEGKQIECLGDWLLTPAVDYQKALKEYNLRAHMFLFIISPDSIKSDACLKELYLAVENRKAILPISYRDHGDDNLLDTALRSPQWVFARNPEQQDIVVSEIIKAVNTDFDLLDTHARFLDNTSEWLQENKSSAYLLNREQLKVAESWLEKTAANPNKLPQPTPSLIEYIVVSRRVKSRSTRIWLAIAIVTAGIFLALAIYAGIERKTAIEQSKIAKKNEAEAKEHLMNYDLKQFETYLIKGDGLSRGREDTLAYEAYLLADSIAKIYPESPIILARKKVLSLQINALKQKLHLK